VASGSRDRVTIDLRGIGPAVRAAACARQITVAAFVREALVEAARPSPESSPPEGDGLDRSEIVKLTLRLPEPDAELVVLKSAALGLSYGAFVGRLVRGAPLPTLTADRAADRDALIASTDHLAELTVDLNALIRMLRTANSEGAERYRNSATSLATDVRRHLDIASRVIARNVGEP
jgi:hypothetical protein